MPKISLRDIYRDARIDYWVKQEEKALKRAGDGEFALLKVMTTKDTNILVNRGWKIAPSTNTGLATAGGYTLQIETEVLRAR